MVQLPTGVPGLDYVLCGGVMPCSAVLLEGPPGCGKTTLGIQFIVNGVQNGEPGLIITFEQFADQLYRDCEQFGWNLRDMERKKQLRVILTSPEVLKEHLLNPQGMVHTLINAMNVKRVLIDSVSHFHRLTNDEAELRELVFSILNALKHRDIIVALTKEVSTGDRPSFEEYMVDTIIALAYEGAAGSKRTRTLEVLKTRGHDHLSGRHAFRFGPGGMVVFSGQIAPVSGVCDGKPDLLETGIAGLDNMLRGGIPAGTTVLICGPAGTGKTTLSLQTMYNNMMSGGHRAVLFLSEEEPETVFRVAGGYGWNFADLRETGLFRVVYDDFVNIDIDEYLYRVDRLLAEMKPSIITVDTLPSLLHTVSESTRMVAEKINQLNRIVKAHRCVAFYISRSPLGEVNFSKFGVEESLCDGIFILQSKKFKDSRKRSIEVYKLRNQKHAVGECRMDIGDRGIRVFYIPPGGFKNDEA